jgi:hypothetical protein
MFDRGELPAIIFGIVIAALFLFGGAPTAPSTLQRSEDNKYKAETDGIAQGRLGPGDGWL